MKRGQKIQILPEEEIYECEANNNKIETDRTPKMTIQTGPHYHGNYKAPLEDTRTNNRYMPEIIYDAYCKYLDGFEDPLDKNIIGLDDFAHMIATTEQIEEQINYELGEGTTKYADNEAPIQIEED